MGHLEKRNQKDRLELPTRSILNGTLKFLPVLAEEEGFGLQSKEMSCDFQAVANAQVVGRCSGRGSIPYSGGQGGSSGGVGLPFVPEACVSALYCVSLVWCCVSVRILTLRT